MSKINDLINELKAPKTQYNSFGKYSYRSNEDIQSGLKPLLAKHDLQLDASSNLKEIAGKIVASVSLKLYDEGLKVAQGDGFAVVDLNKKGMSSEQATGSAFSYASKYAFGQMLLIDDVKDADEFGGNEQANQKPTQKFKMSELAKKVEAGEMTREAVTKLVNAGKVINDMEKNK